MIKFLRLGMLLLSINAVAQDGVLDNSFGTNGKVVTSINSGADKAFGVAVQTDGKIVVAGFTYSAIYGDDFACVRYNADGSLDPTFGTGGKMTYDLQTGSDDRAYAIALQLDGKIIMAGYSDNGSDKAGAVIRINTDGSLDSSFGVAGKAFTNFTIYNTNARGDEFKTVKIHHLSGKIVVGGTSIANSDESKGIFARYLSTGLLDTTFANNGILINMPIPINNSNGYSFVIEDLAVKSNGKISAVGWVDVPGTGALFKASQYTCRLNENGTLDTTFSSDGYAVNSFTTGDDKTYSMILQPDDTFLFCGNTRWSSVDYKHYFGRMSTSGGMTHNGTIDFSSTTIDVAYDMALDSSSKLLMSGSVINSTTSTASFGITRVNSDYSLDATFGTNGKVATDFGANTFSESFAMAVQSDDKIILVGYTGNDFAVARYNGNTLSSPEFENKKRISIYPNPAKNTLNIPLSDNGNTVGDYQIIDLNGRVVVKGLLEIPNKTINIEQLNSGMYIFKTNESTTKFIKE